MNCQEFQERLDNLIEQRSPIEERELTAHALECETCGDLFAETSTLDLAIADWCRVGVDLSRDVNLVDPVAGALEQKTSGKEPRLSPPRFAAIAQWVVALLIPIAMIGIASWGTSKQPASTIGDDFTSLAGAKSTTAAASEVDVERALRAARAAYVGLGNRLTKPIQKSQQLLPDGSRLVSLIVPAAKPVPDDPKTDGGVAGKLGKAMNFLKQAFPGSKAL